MILPDDTPSSPAKMPQGPRPEPQDEVFDAPPAYPGPASAQPQTSYGAVAQPRTVVYQPYNVYRAVDVEASGARSPLVAPLPPLDEGRYKRRAAKRFVKAFLVAGLIYLVVASFIRTIVALSHPVYHHPRFQVRVFHHLRRCVENRSHAHAKSSDPLPSDGKVLRCLNATGVASRMGFIAPYSLSVPLSADAHYIFGRGPLAHGAIEFSVVNDPRIPEGHFRVNVYPRFSSMATLQDTNVCLLERRPGQIGVGILVSPSLRPRASSI